MPFPAFFARHVAFSIAVPLTNLVVSGVSQFSADPMTPSEVQAQQQKVALGIARTVGAGIEKQTQKFLRLDDVARTIRIVRGGVSDLGTITAGVGRSVRDIASGIERFIQTGLLPSDPAF